MMFKTQKNHIAGKLFGASLGLALGWTATETQAQPYSPGVAYFGRNQYVEYIAGDLPLLFSAPHGGSLTPAEIPNRVDDGSDPNFTTVTDSNTEDVALALQQVFLNYFGHSPHVTICQLQRTKIDCNRSLAQGVYNTNVFATQAWNEFQNFINVSSNAAVAQTGFGFYIDLHGQGHTIQRLELGYLLSASQLALSDATLNQATYASQSSIRTLAGKVSTKYGITFANILRGSGSFGSIISGLGYPSVPNSTDPDPGSGNPYFDGGYNTDVHGSHNSKGPIDSLQIEANFTGVRDTAINRTNYVTAIARTLDYFFTNYYGIDLRITAPSIWAGGAGNWATAANWNVAKPVSGNYLMFSGAGGAVNNNLTAVSTGTGRVYSIIFATNASGSYTLYGNAISTVAGFTNFSANLQTISNHITLVSNQTFSAAKGTLSFNGNLTNAGNQLTLISDFPINLNGNLNGAGTLVKSGTNTLFVNGTNSLSGTVSNNVGNLQLSSTASLGSGNVYIAPGAAVTGSGTVGGPVTVLGTIAPNLQTGSLTVTNGLNLTGGGYTWYLFANSTNSPGTNFSQIKLTGGALAISNSTLSIQFTNSATVPNTNNAFWLTTHSWKIIALSGTGTNPASNTFSTIFNGTNSTGRFTTSVDAAGSILLNYLPTPQPLVSASLQTSGSPNVTIAWPSTPGINYLVQYSTDLLSGTWSNLYTFTATNANSLFLDTNYQSPRRFYRVVIP